MKTMKDFYTFDSKGYLTTFAAKPELFDKAIADKKFDKAGKIMDNLIRGHYKGYDFPLIFGPGELGNKFRDVLDMRYPPAYLISDRMKNLLEENNITGWKSYPIELYDRKGNQIFGYNGFSIIGKAGPMDVRNQPIIDIPMGISGKPVKHYAGGFFDIETWDGSDFFILENSYWVIVTKRVVDLLKKNKVTALEYCRFSELTISWSLYNK